MIPHANHFKYSLTQGPNLKVDEPPNNLSTDLIGNSEILYPFIYDFIDNSMKLDKDVNAAFMKYSAI